MPDLSHISIAQAEAIGDEKVKELLKQQALNNLKNMSIGKAEVLGDEKVKDLLNLSKTGNSSGTENKNEEETVVNNTITAQDSLIKKYGIRQEIVIKNDKEDPNIKARRILVDNCKPVEEIEVECIGDLDYRVGFGVHILLPFLAKYYDCLMYIKSVEHEWKPNGMLISTLTLTPSRVMDEKDWTDLEEEDGEISSSSSDLWEKIYALLKQQLGKPYVWGATGPDSFDCSGLVQYCFNQYKDETGITLNRVTTQQVKQGTEVSKDNKEEWQPGDLLFWYASPPYPGHVSIYLGNNQMIHAPKTGDVVRIVDITRTDIYAVRRVLPEVAEANISTNGIPEEYSKGFINMVNDAVTTFTKNMKSWNYKSNIISEAGAHAIDPYLVAAIIAIESNGKPSNSSGAGANGLMQVIGGSFDVPTNIKQGCDIYRQKIKAVGTTNTSIVLSAYNCGEKYVLDAIRKYGLNKDSCSIKEIGDVIGINETKYYPTKVLMAYNALKDKKALQ